MIFILFLKQAFLILFFWHLFLKFFWGPQTKTTSWLPFPCKKPLWKVVFLKYFQDGKWFNGYSRSKCVSKYCQNSNSYITVLHITLKVTSQLFLLSVQTQFCENIPSTIWQFFLENARLCFFIFLKFQQFHHWCCLAFLENFEAVIEIFGSKLIKRSWYWITAVKN